MKIAFIGCGNMGMAMVRGILNAGKYSPQDLAVSCKSKEHAQEKSKELGICAMEDNKAAAAFGDIIFLAVKPQFYEQVIQEIKDVVTAEKIIVSMTPGKTMAWMEELFGTSVKIVRTMPNTPSMVREGMMGMCVNAQVTKEETELVQELCAGFSRTEIVAEHLMDTVTAVSGSSPAYVFMFIEAMADAAVAGGMPRKQAYTFAAQAVLGSAKMVLETGMHPGELKDMVCSPGGTTIQAVRVLEEKGMRSSVFEAMMKCMEISSKV